MAQLITIDPQSGGPGSSPGPCRIRQTCLPRRRARLLAASDGAVSEVWTGAQLRRPPAERAGLELSAASVSALFTNEPALVKPVHPCRVVHRAQPSVGTAFARTIRARRNPVSIALMPEQGGTFPPGGFTLV
jgi:hypothetical protein